MEIEDKRTELIWSALELLQCKKSHYRQMTKVQLFDLLDLVELRLFLAVSDDQVELGSLDLDEALNVPTRLIGSHRFRARGS